MGAIVDSARCAFHVFVNQYMASINSTQDSFELGEDVWVGRELRGFSDIANYEF